MSLNSYDSYKSLVGLALTYRALYYCYNTTVATDAYYDQMEDDIREYETANPDKALSYSPIGTVGSSNIEDYPPHVQRAVQACLLDMQEGL